MRKNILFGLCTFLLAVALVRIGIVDPQLIRSIRAAETVAKDPVPEAPRFAPETLSESQTEYVRLAREAADLMNEEELEKATQTMRASIDDLKATRQLEAVRQGLEKTAAEFPQTQAGKQAKAMLELLDRAMRSDPRNADPFYVPAPQDVPPRNQPFYRDPPTQEGFGHPEDLPPSAPRLSVPELIEQGKLTPVE